ncbi:MAG: hypothetical protein PHV93_04685 [Candidatus Pacebacteria bacterium]|nr:hypothetical protein [Candidatus Paceibacterota bacterium]
MTPINKTVDVEIPTNLIISLNELAKQNGTLRVYKDKKGNVHCTGIIRIPDPTIRGFRKSAFNSD